MGRWFRDWHHSFGGRMARNHGISTLPHPLNGKANARMGKLADAYQNIVQTPMKIERQLTVVSIIAAVALLLAVIAVARHGH